MSHIREISYLGFCALGGLNNPKLFSKACRNGSYVYIKYFYIGY